MAKKSGYKQLNEETFNKIKVLADAIKEVSKVAEFTGASEATVYRIRRAKDFNDYKAKTTTRSKKSLPTTLKSVEVPRQDKKELKGGIEVPKIYAHAESPRTIHALNRIGDQLERLADAWEQAPKKKGLFQ